MRDVFDRLSQQGTVASRQSAVVHHSNSIGHHENNNNSASTTSSSYYTRSPIKRTESQRDAIFNRLYKQDTVVSRARRYSLKQLPEDKKSISSKMKVNITPSPLSLLESRKDPPCKLLNVTVETVNSNDDEDEDEYDDDDDLCSEADYNDVSDSSDDDAAEDDEYVSEEESEEDESEEEPDEDNNYNSDTAYSSSNNDEEEAVLDNHDEGYTAIHYVDCKDCGAFHHVDYQNCGVSTSHLCNIGYCIDGLSCNEEECSNGNPFRNKCHIRTANATSNKQIICKMGYCIDGLSCNEECPNGNPFSQYYIRKTATSSNKQIIERNKPIRRITLSNHLLERCEERGISSYEVREIIRNNKGVSNHFNGTTEYYQHGICCITRRNVYNITSANNDGYVRVIEEVGITAFEQYCKECGDSNDETKLCSKGYCHDCCWGCNECNASLGLKCKECGYRGFDNCKNDRGVFCESCCYGCDKCEGPKCNSCRDRGFNHCKNDRGVFCQSCCYGCEECEGPRCNSCRDRGFNHCKNDRGVFCESCCYGCDDCW